MVKRRYNRKNVCYMIVTADKYELPMCIRNRLDEMSAEIGYQPRTLAQLRCRGQTFTFNNVRCKVERVFL